MNSINELLESINSEAENTNQQEPQETPKPVETPVPEHVDSSEQEEAKEGEEGESEVHEESKEGETEKKEEAQKPVSRANQRIRELNEAKKQAESRAAQLEAQLQSIEARRLEIEKLAEGEMPDPSKFSTMQDYVNALTEAKVQAALKANEQARLKAEAERAETAYVQEIVGSFEQKVQIAAQANPDLPKAVEHLNKLANHIPVEVRQALLTDENAAQLAWDLATNQELLDYVCKQNPVNSIKVLAKLSAKYDVDEAPAKSAVGSAKVQAFTPSKPKAPAIPKSGTGGKASDSMTPAQYFKAFQQGKVSKPWEM